MPQRRRKRTSTGRRGTAMKRKPRRASGANRRSTRRSTGRSATSRRSAARRRPARRRNTRRWSRQVTERSDALDLQKGVFKLDSPRRIAASLKRSAEKSGRRKADPYRSALSMLTFYINRAGRNLPARRKKALQQAKGELRRQFGRQ